MLFRATCSSGGAVSLIHFPAPAPRSDCSPLCASPLVSAAAIRRTPLGENGATAAGPSPSPLAGVAQSPLGQSPLVGGPASPAVPFSPMIEC